MVMGVTLGMGDGSCFTSHWGWCFVRVTYEWRESVCPLSIRILDRGGNQPTVDNECQRQ